MGRGNWRPYQNENIFQLRYIDLYERYDLDPSEDCLDAWFIFKEDILEALPKSFFEDLSKNTSQIPYSHFSQDNLVLFRNELVCIMIDANASADKVGVAMVCLENSSTETWVENFAKKYMETEAPKFFKNLGGEQYVRTSAYTSDRVQE